MKHDIFISHASEDKISFVAPLARALVDLGLNVWYDEFSLKLGDSLSRSIDKGLAESSFGIVVLSPSFLAKPWPEYELRGLVAKELGQDKVILPIWHGVTRNDVLEFSPPLADKLALNTSNSNLDSISISILEVVRPEIYQNLMRLRLLKIAQEAEKRTGEKLAVRPDKINSGPIRHSTLPKSLLVRINLIHKVFYAVFPSTIETLVEAFMRDANPETEIEIWEKMAVIYLETLSKRLKCKRQEKLEIYMVTLAASSSLVLTEEMARQFKYLSYDEVIEILMSYLNVVPDIPVINGK